MPGSERVSRAGFSVRPKRTFLDAAPFTLAHRRGETCAIF